MSRSYLVVIRDTIGRNSNGYPIRVTRPMKGPFTNQPDAEFFCDNFARLMKVRAFVQVDGVRIYCKDWSSV